MATAYVKYEVSLHGLARNGAALALADIENRLIKALQQEFQPELEGDIELVLIESAGGD